MAKKIISLSIDEKVYSKYIAYCKEEGIIMSRQVEKFMQKKLEENK